jgi:hypothetical protein
LVAGGRRRPEPVRETVHVFRAHRAVRLAALAWAVLCNRQVVTNWDAAASTDAAMAATNTATLRPTVAKIL